MTTYYHVNALNLSTGALMKPANLELWLKEYCTIGSIGEMGNFAELSRELILENIRKKKFADKPSRLGVNFLFENLHAAKAYGLYAIPNGIIYEASIVDENAKQHRGDFGLFLSHTNNFQRSFIDFYERAAAKYWGDLSQNEVDANETVMAQKNALPEILTESAIRIKRKIQPVSDPVYDSLKTNAV